MISGGGKLGGGLVDQSWYPRGLLLFLFRHKLHQLLFGPQGAPQCLHLRRGLGFPGLRIAWHQAMTMRHGQAGLHLLDHRLECDQGFLCLGGWYKAGNLNRWENHVERKSGNNANLKCQHAWPLADSKFTLCLWPLGSDVRQSTVGTLASPAPIPCFFL